MRKLLMMTILAAVLMAMTDTAGAQVNWVAWSRDGFEDQYWRWKPSEHSPFSSRQACEQTGHEMLRRFVQEAEAKFDVPSWRFSNGGLRLEMDQRFAPFSAIGGLFGRTQTYVIEYRCWPLGVNPQ